MLADMLSAEHRDQNLAIVSHFCSTLSITLRMPRRRSETLQAQREYAECKRSLVCRISMLKRDAEAGMPAMAGMPNSMLNADAQRGAKSGFSHGRLYPMDRIGITVALVGGRVA
jgi:hypothetical protein